MYNSRYYTVEEIDERLLQGCYDDAVAAGYTKTKEEFDRELFEYHPVCIQDTLLFVKSVTPGDANVIGDVVYEVKSNKFFTRKLEGSITRYYAENSLQPIIGTSPVEGAIYLIGKDIYMGIRGGITQLGHTIIPISDLKTAFIVDNKPTSLASRIIIGVANPNMVVMSTGNHNYNSGTLLVTSDSFRHCLNLQFNTMCIPNAQGEFDGGHEHGTGYPREWVCHFTFDYEGGDYHRNTWSKWRCPQEETQNQINALVLKHAKLNLSASPSVFFKGDTTSVKLTAKLEGVEGNIVIKKGDEELANGVGGTVTGTTSITATTSFRAEAEYQGIKINTTATSYGEDPIYIGAGAAYTDINTEGNKLSARRSPTGTYNVKVATNGHKVFINVPNNMSVNSVIMGVLPFPMKAAVPQTINGKPYKVYESENTYQVSTLTLKVS